jgi:hypothetical protein
MEVGIAIGLVSMLSVIAIYFWIVRRANNEVVEQK